MQKSPGPGNLNTNESICSLPGGPWLLLDHSTQYWIPGDQWPWLPRLLLLPGAQPRAHGALRSEHRQAGCTLLLMPQRLVLDHPLQARNGVGRGSAKKALWHPAGPLTAAMNPTDIRCMQGGLG